MQTFYYIDVRGEKQGPLDLITIIRRVRMQKITPATPIYVGDANETVPASQISEIAYFFTQPQGINFSEIKTPSDLRNIISQGWRFTADHNIMTAFAGGMLLLSMLLAVILINGFGLFTGGIMAWVTFITLHNFYLLFALRMYRGQTFSPDFINHQFGPILPSFLLSCLLLSLMMAGGIMLLIIPGLIVAVYYIFVPFMILDHKLNPVAAMQASRALLHKHSQHSLSTIMTLIALHLVCMALIVPIPLTLPLFSAALAALYEELSAL